MKYLIALSLLFSSGILLAQNYQTIEEIDSACATLSFSGNEEAEIAVDEILQKIGLFRNFILQECPDINNAVAKVIEVSEGNSERFILYDNNFFNKMNDKANTDWASMSILAHEIGHHLNGHSLNNKGSNHEFELEADFFSGYAMAKLGASLLEAQSAINSLVYEKATRTHPAKNERLAQIKKGWVSAENNFERKEDVLPNATESLILYKSDLNMRSSLFEEASVFYESSQYEKAAIRFVKAFQYGAGEYPEDLYYAATSFLLAKNNIKAQFYYKLLEKKGIEKLDAETQNTIYKNIGLIASILGDEKEAFAYFDFLLKKDPSNTAITIARANIYYQNGNVEAYRDELLRLLQFDPYNYDYCFNLGVIFYELNNYEKSHYYYSKAIDIDDQKFNSQFNLGVLILSKEEAIINEMNSLGMSDADNKKYDKLKISRKNLYKDAAYYLYKAHTINTKEKELIKTLANIYKHLGNTKRYNEFTEKLRKLE